MNVLAKTSVLSKFSDNFDASDFLNGLLSPPL